VPNDSLQPERPAVNRWIIVLSVMSATVMEVLDTTVVNVSLPPIAANLSATIEEATWVLSSYLVANAIVLPMTGWLAGQVGRKRLLMTAVAGFTISSFLCGFAPNLAWLIVFRIAQGLSGGCLQPLSQAVMLESFPTEERGKAMAVWGLAAIIAPTMGPVMGGWVTENYSWRWVFYINIPIGITSLILLKLFLFDPPYIRRRSSRIDYWGIGLLAVGVGALQMMLDKGQLEDWFASGLIQVLAVISAIALAVFLVHELTTPHPVLDLRVLKIRGFSTGVVLITAVGFVLYGSTILLPLLLQTLLGYPATEAGLAMAPRGIGTALTVAIVGWTVARFDPRKMLAAGLVLAVVTLFDLSRLNLNAGYWDFFWPQLVQGASLSLLFVPLTTATMAPIPKEEMGNATSIYSLMRNLGGSLGIATIATLLARRQQFHAQTLGANVNPYSDSTRSALEGARTMFLSGGSDLATATQQSYAAVFGIVHRQAALLSFLEAFRLLAVLFLAMLPLLLLMDKPRRRNLEKVPRE